MAYGGDITDVTFSNSEVGSGSFKAKAGEGNTYDTGGIRVADDAGSVTTDGTMIVVKNRKLGFFQILIANDMNVRKDLETMSKLAASLSPTVWTFTCINGKTYRGSGEVVGDHTGDIDKATVPLKVQGPEFKQI